MGLRRNRAARLQQMRRCTRCPPAGRRRGARARGLPQRTRPALRHPWAEGPARVPEPARPGRL